MKPQIFGILTLAFAMGAQGATVYTSAFSANDEGWVDRDASEMAVSHAGGFGNPAGSLRGDFAAQGIPSPESDAFRANSGTASGAFVGDYSAINATALKFNFYAADVTPSDLVLRFNGASYTFFRSLGSLVTGVGSWYSITVPLTWDASWIGSGAANFATALASVQWVDVQVTRSGTGSQTYYMDNFELKNTPLDNGGGGGGAVPEPRTGIFALWIGALLLSRRKMLLKRA